MALQKHEREQFIQKTVRQLRKLALAYRSEGNQKRASAARRAARQLDEWWKGGARGKAPVDLREFGMEDAAAVLASWAGREAPPAAEEDEEEMTQISVAPPREEKAEEAAQQEAAPEAAAGAQAVEEPPSASQEDEIVQRLAEAHRAAQQGQWEDVLTAAREIQRLAPDNPEADQLRRTAETRLQEARHLQAMAGLQRRITAMLQKETGVDVTGMEQLVRAAEAAAATWQAEGLLATPEGQAFQQALDALRRRRKQRLPSRHEAPAQKPSAEQRSETGEAAESPAPPEETPQPAASAEAAPSQAPPSEESAVAEEDERTDLGNRRIAHLRQLLRQDKYEEAYDQATEALKEKLSEVQREVLRQIRDEARTNLVAQWMAKANEAYQNERWEDVLNWVRKVQQVEPEHADAERLRREADGHLQRAEHLQAMAGLQRRITAMLQKETGVDVTNMEQLVREAEASVGEWREEGLLDSDAGRALETALRELRAHFDKKREAQGSKTTAEAAKTYESVVEAIPAMEAALRQGEKTWWDDRSGTYRPITELLDEMRVRLPELARDVALRHSKKAEAALEVHRPKEAQEEVAKGLALESVPADVRADLEALQVKVRAELEKWEKAEALLQQANRESSTPKRWSLLRQAAEIYPEHPDVISARERALEDVVAWAEGEIADRLSAVEGLIEQDKFQEAYRLLNRLKTTIKKLGLPEEEAAGLFEKVAEGEETVKAAEERRQAIRALAAKIRDLLQQGEVSQAREIYLGALAAHGDWESDRDFGPLGDEIRAKLGDREKLEEARRLYERGEWEKARQTIAPITSAELAPEVEKLQAAIAASEAVADIQALWERGYYYETLKRIEGVLTSRGENLSEKDRRRLEEYKAEIEQRRSGDQDVWLALGKVGLRSFDALADEAVWNKDVVARLTADVEGFSEVVRIHHALEEALKVPSTLEGYLRDAENRLETWVRQYGKQIVEGLKADGKWNLVREWLDTWTQNWRHVERRWREGLYRAYFEQRARQLEQEEAWDDLVDMWVEAQSVLPNVFEFVSREKEARRARLLAEARAGLSTGRPEDTKEALEVLEDDREVWDDTVRAVHYLANRLYDLDSKLEMGQLEGIQAFRDGILEEWQRQEEAHTFLSKEALAEILNKRFVLAAQKLLKRGDEVREDNPQDALIAYARGLQLPLPPDQQEILRKRLEAFGHLAQRYVVDLAQALNQIQVMNTRPLAEQLETAKAQRMQAWALIGVLPIILSPQEKTQWEKSLREGLRKAEAVIDALEEALDILRRYREDGEEWAAVLREGQWARVEQDIADVVKQMNTTPPELAALQQRVEEASKQRETLVRLRDKADEAYRKEDFEAGMRAINAIRTLLAERGVTPDGDPFGVVPQMRVLDMERTTMVEGVDAIYRLLEERAANAREWETWRDALNEARDALKPQVERLKNWPDPDPTAAEVRLIDSALAACQKALAKGKNPPTEPPMSERARKAQVEGEKSRDQVEEWHTWLEDDRKRRWVDMAALMREAYDLINAGNVNDAAPLIEKGLHYQPGHEFLTYLKQANENYRGETAASGAFWSRFLGR